MVARQKCRVVTNGFNSTFHRTNTSTVANQCFAGVRAKAKDELRLHDAKLLVEQRQAVLDPASLKRRLEIRRHELDQVRHVKLADVLSLQPSKHFKQEHTVDIGQAPLVVKLDSPRHLANDHDVGWSRSVCILSTNQMTRKKTGFFPPVWTDFNRQREIQLT